MSSGMWDAPLEQGKGGLDIVGVHAVVLYTGKVLYWCFDQSIVGKVNSDPQLFADVFANPGMGSYQLWDPVSGTPGPPQEIGRNAFCAGQCAMPDGTIFVAGGQDQFGAVEVDNDWLTQAAKWFGDALTGGSDEGALKDIHTYDPAADAWQMWPRMPDGRYYPTCVELPDGSAFVAGGLSNLQKWVFSGGNWCQNDQFQIFPAGEILFAGPPQHFRSADQYPIIRLLPGSNTLFVHIETTTYLFDLGSHSFIENAQFMPPAVGRQTYPMQTGHVLMPQKEGDPPRILIVGGSSASGFDYNTHSDAPAVDLAFIFEFDAASPQNSRWRTTKGRPNSARLLSDTVLLPDGTVFIVNGISVGAAAGHSGACVGTAEIFDPVTETFSLQPPPSAAHPRGYHATAVLLPDARVAVAGNTATYNPGETGAVDDVSIEIFNPPYLSAGPRPTVSTTIPQSLDYGSTLTIDNSATPAIDAVMLMRPCAVTHSVDMDQRAVQLVVSPGAQPNSLNIKIPSDRSLAPPGPYMLFFLAKGVPSNATFVFVGAPFPSGGGPNIGPPADCASGGPWAPVNLGTYDGAGKVTEAFDGDCTIDKVDNGFVLVLESRHGGITINQKIDQGSYAELTSCTSVSIGQKIDQHSTAIILAHTDVGIGQSIDAGSQAQITSTKGGLDIGQKIDQTSNATINVATTVHIGQKIDQHSIVTIVAQGDVNIDQGIDQHAQVDITSVNGSITIGQAVDGNANATLRAPNGSITIGQKVAGGATVLWHAMSFNCPDTGGGTVTHI